MNYKQDAAGKKAEDAVIDTINTTGISILYTSLVLTAGFIIFCFSDFGGILALGWLTSLPLVIAWLRASPVSSGKLLAIVLGAFGFYAPNLWLRSRVKARQLAIVRALPDTLDLMVTCVEAGLGLAQEVPVEA